jgi:serine/threonine-protein kinase RsbW
VLFNHPLEEPNKLIQQYQLRVNTELPELDTVLRWFEQFAQPLLPEKCFWQIQLALSEAFTNTVLYAHSGLSVKTPIELEVKFFTRHLEIRIWDFGDPFDLQAKIQYLSEQQRDPLEQESDRGLFFMKELTDALDYSRDSDDRNCLLMKKAIADGR